MKTRHHVQWFPESGEEYIIEVGMLDDVATVALDASGAGLNRRGYRRLNAEAPLAETLAAGYGADQPLAGGQALLGSHVRVGHHRH